MRFSHFLIQLGQRINELLMPLGFNKRKDDLFVRFGRDHKIDVISIQKHSYEPRVCVNLGVHYDFLPKIGTTEFPVGGHIDLPGCEIKTRLTPSILEHDYWWPIEEDSIGNIVNLIEDRAILFFDKYALSGEVSCVSPEDLAGEIPDLLGSLTKVRASLLLARLHEINGNPEIAEKFAKIGIEAAGKAVGPKKMLKEILKRISTRD